MQWIDIEKQRPKDFERVIACDMYGAFVTLGQYFEKEDCFALVGVEGLEEDSYPTHWLPLPEPVRCE